MINNYTRLLGILYSLFVIILLAVVWYFLLVDPPNFGLSLIGMGGFLFLASIFQILGLILVGLALYTKNTSWGKGALGFSVGGGFFISLDYIIVVQASFPPFSEYPYYTLIYSIYGVISCLWNSIFRAPVFIFVC